MNLNVQETYSPIGRLTIGATEKGVCLILFNDEHDIDKEVARIQKELKYDLISVENRHITKAKEELKLYFDRKLCVFKTPIDLIGSNFQRLVWAELLNIPYGETISYKEQALRLGNLKAIRAVANANGKNKISIIVPCHRVIGANGSLTGYSGGLERKRKLLLLESSMITQNKSYDRDGLIPF